MKIRYTGCPILLDPLSFCHFLGFWSTYRGPFDHFSTALEICYIIATRILKIDLEIAEIIEVKVGTRHLEIDILLLHRGRKKISMLKMATLTSIISAIFLIRFSKFLCLFGSKFPEFYKNVPTFEICMSRSPQKSK